MSNTSGDISTVDRDCAVCLQICHHPTQLPCGHVFCFLCVKGVAIQSKRCAMCRAQIPSNYLDNPLLLEKLSPIQVNPDQIQDGYQWYYEGRNGVPRNICLAPPEEVFKSGAAANPLSLSDGLIGWWQYDERSNIELEAAFSNGEVECTLLLAGALYIIDFQSMTQLRSSNQTKRRRVRRDTPLFPAKGIAGIKTESIHVDLTKSEDEQDTNSDEHTEHASVGTVAEDAIESDSISIPAVPRVDGAVADISERLGFINLDESESPGG